MKRYKLPNYIQIDEHQEGEFVRFEDANRVAEQAFEVLLKYVHFANAGLPPKEDYSDTEYEIIKYMVERTNQPDSSCDS